MSITIDPTKVRPLGPGQDLKCDMSVASQQGRMVYLSAEDSAPNKAIATPTDAQAAVSASGVIGMIVAGSRHNTDGLVIAGETVTVRVFGRVWLGDASLSLTDVLFLEDENSGADGLLDTASGTVTRRAARPVADEVIFIDGVSMVEPLSS